MLAYVCVALGLISVAIAFLLFAWRRNLRLRTTAIGCLASLSLAVLCACTAICILTISGVHEDVSAIVDTGWVWAGCIMTVLIIDLMLCVASIASAERRIA